MNREISAIRSLYRNYVPETVMNDLTVGKFSLHAVFYRYCVPENARIPVAQILVSKWSDNGYLPVRIFKRKYAVVFQEHHLFSCSPEIHFL